MKPRAARGGVIVVGIEEFYPDGIRAVCYCALARNLRACFAIFLMAFTTYFSVFSTLSDIVISDTEPRQMS